MSETMLKFIESNPENVKPNACVIWLHGLGADGHDFADAVPYLQLPEKHAIRFIFPHAPHRAVTINGGMSMPAWYDIFALELNAPQDAAGIQTSEKQIQVLIEAQVKSGISKNRIFLVGFSQGGAVALYTALRSSDRLAGAAALSSYLPLQDELSKLSLEHLDMPILMAHGLSDPVVPLFLGQQSYAYLQIAGFNPSWYTYAMDHSVCSEEFKDLGAWIAEILG